MEGNEIRSIRTIKYLIESRIAWELNYLVTHASSKWTSNYHFQCDHGKNEVSFYLLGKMYTSNKDIGKFDALRNF